MRYLLGALVVVASGCNSQPDWVSRPYSDETTLCSVASSNEGSLATKKRIAYVKAKAELGRIVQVRIATRYQKAEKCHDEACIKVQKSRSQHASTLYLQKAWVKERFHDTAQGIYYTMVCVQR